MWTSTIIAKNSHNEGSNKPIAKRRNMKAIEVIKLLKNEDSYITEFYDYDNHKREITLVANGGDYFTLHWKVFETLLNNDKIYDCGSMSTMQPNTETITYKPS